jgi:hypothetical protein
MKLDTDNCEPRLTEDEQVVVEPSYITYIRNQGYTIESVDDIRVVPSESDKDKAYLVMTVTTYEYPKNHPQLDYAQHEYQLHTCSCWSYRQDSKDIGPSNGHKPDGSCKHIKAEYKTEKARQDDSQTELV